MKSAVVLATMPWDNPGVPSLQLGLMKAVLTRAGIDSTVRHLSLDALSWLIAADPERHARATLGDYLEIGGQLFRYGGGEWIFARLAAGGSAPTDDEAYLDWLRSEKLPERVIGNLRRMRELAAQLVERCADEVLALEPRVVACTLYLSQNLSSLALARAIKRRDPSVKIVLGGSSCEGPMGAALFRAHDCVDAIVRGEGERVFPPLVAQLLAGEPIQPQPGLCFRQGAAETVVPMDGAETVRMPEVPSPSFDDYFEQLKGHPLERDLRALIKLPYESARGCWWGAKAHCTFCGLNGSTMAFRSKPADQVFAEMTELSARHGCLDFSVVDNIIDLDYLRTLLPRFVAAGYDLSLFYETKANLKKEHIQLFRESGVRAIQPGIESLSNPILKHMRKGITALQNVRLLKWCAELDVLPLWNIIYGFPGEDPAEYEAMAELVASLVHLPMPSLVKLGIDRFSPYHQTPSQFGLELTGPAPYYRFLYPVDAATLDQLAYVFAYRYHDGRDPESYVEPLRRAVDNWRANLNLNKGALTVRQGPGFIRILDRRTTCEQAEYVLGELESEIYLACDAGATAESIALKLRMSQELDVGEDEVREFLDGMAEHRLVFRDGDRYLSLAVAEDALRHRAHTTVEEPSEAMIYPLRRKTSAAP